MDRLIVTGDILRVGPAGRPDQWSNIGWLKRLLSPALEIATGSPQIDKVTWISKTSEFDGSMVYAAHGLQPGLLGWAELFHKEPNALALAYMAEFLEGAVVVGFELSPYLRRALDGLNSTYIDLCIHPVRFMEDLLLYAASNNEDVSKRIQDFALTNADFRLRSTFLAGAWRRQGYVEPRRHSAALLCLQTPLDRVLIDQGQFISIKQFLPRLREIRSSFDRLYVKQHPIDNNDAAVGFVMDHVRDIEVVDKNFYEMIARHEVDDVYSLSSGTSIEARHLGLKGHHLFRDYYECLDNRAGGGPYHPVMDEVLWPDFWRKVLAPVTHVTPLGGYRRAVGKETLRRTLGQAWDFSKWV